MVKKGDRVQVILMKDTYAPVPAGTKGTVKFIDDAGHIHVQWDNGSRLSLLPDVDQYRILTHKDEK